MQVIEEGGEPWSWHDMCHALADSGLIDDDDVLVITFLWSGAVTRPQVVFWPLHVSLLTGDDSGSDEEDASPDEGRPEPVPDHRGEGRGLDAGADDNGDRQPVEPDGGSGAGLLVRAVGRRLASLGRR